MPVSSMSLLHRKKTLMPMKLSFSFLLNLMKKKINVPFKKRGAQFFKLNFNIFVIFQLMKLSETKWRHDIRYNDAQQSDTRHNITQQNDIKHKRQLSEERCIMIIALTTLSLTKFSMTISIMTLTINTFNIYYLVLCQHNVSFNVS